MMPPSPVQRSNFGRCQIHWQTGSSHCCRVFHYATLRLPVPVSGFLPVVARVGCRFGTRVCHWVHTQFTTHIPGGDLTFAHSAAAEDLDIDPAWVTNFWEALSFLLPLPLTSALTVVRCFVLSSLLPKIPSTVPCARALVDPVDTSIRLPGLLQ